MQGKIPTENGTPGSHIDRPALSCSSTFVRSLISSHLFLQNCCLHLFTFAHIYINSGVSSHTLPTAPWFRDFYCHCWLQIGFWKKSTYTTSYCLHISITPIAYCLSLLTTLIMRSHLNKAYVRQEISLLHTQQMKCQQTESNLIPVPKKPPAWWNHLLHSTFPCTSAPEKRNERSTRRMKNTPLKKKLYKSHSSLELSCVTSPPLAEPALSPLCSVLPVGSTGRNKGGEFLCKDPLLLIYVDKRLARVPLNLSKSCQERTTFP